MELTTEDATIIREPSESELQVALGRLGLPGNGYAILASSPQNYIQVAGSKADGYVVEYREGSESAHHSSMVNDLPHKQMCDLLSVYLDGGSWKSMVSWQSGFGVDTSSKSSSKGRRKIGPSNAHKIVLALFFVVGLISLSVSAYLGFTTKQYLERSVEVPGKVVQLVRRDSMYAPVVEYIDLQGHRRTLHSNQSSSPPSFFKGQEVKVVYDPADPEYPLTARIATFMQLWGSTLFALVFGSGFGGIALAQWMILYRRRP